MYGSRIKLVDMNWQAVVSCLDMSPNCEWNLNFALDRIRAGVPITKCEIRFLWSERHFAVIDIDFNKTIHCEIRCRCANTLSTCQSIRHLNTGLYYNIEPSQVKNVITQLMINGL